MEDTSLRRLMQQAMDDDEPGLSPRVITGAVSAARRIRRRRMIGSASGVAVATALVVLLATGVLTPMQDRGATTPATSKSPTPTRPSRPVVPGMVDGHFSLVAEEALFSFLPATGAQGALGAQFDRRVALLEIASTNSCMARYSYSGKAGALVRNFELYLNPPLGSPAVAGFVPQDEAAIPNLYDLTLLAHGLMSEVLIGSPNGPNVPASVFNTIDSRFMNCQKAAAQPFSRLEHDGGEPYYQWARQVRAIQSSPPAVAANSGYGSCVQRHGAPATAAQSPDGFWYWLNNLVTPSSGGFQQHIAERTALDRHWTQVFVGCAAGVLAVEGRLQLAAQKVYLSRHYDQVLTVERLAIQVISRLEHK